ncbi:MAG: hypothetical protein CUN56_14205 [Phototrophicales bacterium]|nr:MAG: hypothetical protein CUN56_14205 [Phototrophicales bacterium]RMG76102.1 MAG: hypothetical protein D6711_04830 [Chloroflexota bacterium]
MGIKVHWENQERTIIRQVLKGRWTVEEYLHSAEKIYKLLNGLPHIVHLIIDARESDGIPANFLSIARQLDQLVANNQGLVLAIIPDPHSRTIVQAARRIAPKATRDLHYVDHLSDAYQMIDRLAETV